MPTLRPALKTALALACVTAFTASYFVHYPIPSFGITLLSILRAAALLLAAYGAGQVLLRRLEVQTTLLENIVFAATLGWGLLSTMMVIAGLFHGWTPAVAKVLTVILVLIALPGLRALGRDIPSTTTDVLLPFWPSLGLSITLIAGALLAFAPITYYDSLVYHYSLPALYTQSRHWVGASHFIYSAFPQTLEMLWTLGLLIGGDRVSNLVAFCLSLLVLAAVVSFSRRFMSLPVGYIAATLLGVMPAFLLLSSGGYIETGLMLFAFTSLYAVFRWHYEPTAGWMVIAGLLAGWTMGTKYTGLLPSAIAFVFILADRDRPWSVRLKSAGIFAGTALIVFSPWLIKNWHYTGNPVFPFFQQWGATSRNPWQTQAAQGYFQALVEYQPRRMTQMLSTLWEISVQGLRFGSGADVLGSLGWAPFFCFLPWLWIGQKPHRTSRWLLVYSLLFFIPWMMMRPVLRFLMPLLPVLALLTAQAWVGGVRTQSQGIRWLMCGFLGLFVLSGVSLFLIVTDVFSPWNVALGLETREAYLSKKLNYYPAAQFINQSLPGTSTLYLFGDQRGYYYQRRVIFNTVFSRNWMAAWADEATTPAALREAIVSRGITHILINRTEMQRLSSYNHFTMTPEGQQRWSDFQKTMTRSVYHDIHCDVLEILPA